MMRKYWIPQDCKKDSGKWWENNLGKCVPKEESQNTFAITVLHYRADARLRAQSSALHNERYMTSRDDVTYLLL